MTDRKNMDDISKIRDVLHSLGFTPGDTDVYTDGTKVTEYFKDGIEINITIPANM